MSEVIVVGTDGSETADRAVRHAAALAKLRGARLDVVSGYHEDHNTNGGAAGAANNVLERAAEKLRAEGLKVETHCVAGDPADAIIDVAESMKADLIVVGSVGMRGSRRFLLGSVPNKVSHHAPCSVLIVRTD